MRKVSYFLNIIAVAVFAVFAFTVCGCSAKQSECPDESIPYKVETIETFVPADTINGVPEYTILEKSQVDLSAFPKDKDGVITIFCGKSFYGWRGYDKDVVPARWVIDEEEGAIKLNGAGEGEAQKEDGGDLVFAHKFKNFELSFEWKVAKGSNSGVFVLAQEIKGEPIYVSSPEYQILDNDNHADAKQGVDGNRKSASLYDMIPAKPQNAKPFGEWNTGKITVFKGSVFYEQNGKTVVEYHLWTPQWKEMLDNCKFSKDKWPLAYHFLLNLGGPEHEGYIGLQDHSDDVWYRNIKVKVTD